jgi:hypothetical protein
MDTARSYFVAARGALGARFVQDPAEGSTGTICIGAVDPDGGAASRGIVAGMILRGVAGDDMAGKSFNDVMLAAKAAKKAGKLSEDETWELNLTPPWDLDEEETVYWTAVLKTMGLQFGETPEDRSPQAPVTHAEPESPVTHAEPVSYRVIAAATVRDGPEPSSRKLGEHSKGTVIQVAHEQSNSDGLRIAFTITPPPGASRGGFVKLATSKGKLLLERVIETPPPTPSPRKLRRSLSRNFSLPEGDPPVEIKRTALSEVACYNVLSKASIRNSLSAGSKKIGEYQSGCEIKVVEHSISEDGLPMARSITPQSDQFGASGGWVKVMTHKGKHLLERKSAVVSSRVTLTTGATESEQLIELVFEGSGKFGLAFRQDQFGGTEVYKIAEDFVASGMDELQRGMKLHSISGSLCASMNMTSEELVNQVRERWSQRGKLTVMFSGGDHTSHVAAPKEPEAAAEASADDDPASAEEGSSGAESSGEDSPISAEEAEESPEKVGGDDVVDSVKETDPHGDCSPKLLTFLQTHNCESYVESLRDDLGVSDIDDLRHLRSQDLDLLRMKVVPRRRLEHGIELLRQHDAVEEAVPPANAADHKGKWTIYICPFVATTGDGSVAHELERIVQHYSAREVETIVVKAAGPGFANFCEVCHIHGEGCIDH